MAILIHEPAKRPVVVRDVTDEPTCGMVLLVDCMQPVQGPSSIAGWQVLDDGECVTF